MWTDHERRHAPIPLVPMTDRQIHAERKLAAAICVTAGQALTAAKAREEWGVYHFAREVLEDGIARWREFTC